MPAQSRRRHPAQEEEDDEEEEEPTQRTQRGRGRAAVSDDDSEEEPDDGEEMEVDAGVDTQDQAVKKLIRYALACEFQRLVIRRTGIAEKGWSPVRQAQKQLRSKFGMEMVALPEREKVQLRDKRNALKSKKGAKSSVATSYILTTTLPPAYRDPAIIAPSLIGNSEDEAAYIALCTVIVAYIAMNPGGQVPDYKLARMLKRMNAETNVPGGTKTEVALARMERQGYIWKVKENTGEDETTDWRVGPRGKIEIGNRGIQGFVREVYGEDATEDLDKRLNRSLGVEARVVGPEEELAAEHNDGRPRTQAARERRRLADDEED
ncbi:hypothetical protein GLAREA_02389 [Glarea lozoyensis ATCC 20868]|uniref:MAGE domain-containing protein n=1 Tax=Glarea lozoyensis (strain ATCC 20868 / MF5171) TaxID=1116229 RepID=S3D333_GLAL2|nr:uncharacterized protein GLAREA_02389 [Glarea lozoyensis ATCC 20868]EPE26476.1 hypothetical protein GLAREA_02389 [Glarea lozoyensis ATCC 20868]